MGSTYLYSWAKLSAFDKVSQFYGCPIILYIGFNHAFTSMLPEIKSFLKEHPTITGTVHCIGHSLGGAVATLAADWIARNKPNPVKLYTFGAPRVGGSFFASSCTNAVGAENIRRLFHSTDPVPMVPIFPFVHAPTRGSNYHLPSTLPMMSGESHAMKNYIISVKEKGWPALEGNKRNECQIYGCPIISDYFHGASIYVLSNQSMS